MTLKDDLEALKNLPVKCKEESWPCDGCGKEKKWVREAFFVFGGYYCLECMKKEALKRGHKDERPI